jgi:hypothetical protein
MKKKKKSSLILDKLGAIVVILGLVSGMGYVLYGMSYNNNIVTKNNYLQAMKTAWSRSPQVLQNIKQIQLNLENLSTLELTQQRIEEFAEYEIILQGSVTESNELIRRMNNLFPMKEQRTIHQDFHNFLSSLRSTEINLLEYCRDHRPSRLEKSRIYLEKAEVEVTKIP